MKGAKGERRISYRHSDLSMHLLTVYLPSLFNTLGVRAIPTFFIFLFLYSQLQ